MKILSVLAQVLVGAEAAYVHCGPYTMFRDDIQKRGGKIYFNTPDHQVVAESSPWHVELFENGTYIAPGKTDDTYLLEDSLHGVPLSPLVKLCKVQLDELRKPEIPQMPNGSTIADSFERDTVSSDTAMPAGLVSGLWRGVVRALGLGSADCDCKTEGGAAVVKTGSVERKNRIFFKVNFANHIENL